MANKIIKGLITLLALLFVLPMAYTLMLSLSNISFENVRLVLPTRIDLSYYYSLVFFKQIYFDYFKSSLLMTVIIIFGQISIGVFAAYAFAKLDFPGRNVLFTLYVLILLLPFQVTMVPNYLFFDTVEKLFQIKILDTSLALILPGIFHSFGIFLLRQFIVDIPNEIIEAAKVDGASDFRILFTVVLPTIKSGVAALVILTFIDYWNIIEQAVVFITSIDNQPLSIFLNSIYQSESLGIYAAASVLYMIPVAWLVIKGQNVLMETSFKEIK